MENINELTIEGKSNDRLTTSLNKMRKLSSTHSLGRKSIDAVSSNSFAARSNYKDTGEASIKNVKVKFQQNQIYFSGMLLEKAHEE